MYRIVRKKRKGRVVEEKVCGVLTDFDLALRTEDLAKEQGTGTPPYMAYELLDGSGGPHLYRHDLESLLYIMLVLATHYDIRPPTGEKEGGLCLRQGLKRLPYQSWFDQPSYWALSAFKQGFFTKLIKLDLSPSFKDFGGWLVDLRRSFWRGFCFKQDYNWGLVGFRKEGEESMDQDTTTFDDETLGDTLPIPR